jgi:hypothetical protein
LQVEDPVTVAVWALAGAATAAAPPRPMRAPARTIAVRRSEDFSKVNAYSCERGYQRARHRKATATTAMSGPATTPPHVVVPTAYRRHSGMTITTSMNMRNC